MTVEKKEELIQTVLKGGSMVAIMSVAVWILWGAFSSQTAETKKELQREIELLRKDSKECSESYKQLLLSDHQKLTEALMESNRLIKDHQKK